MKNLYIIFDRFRHFIPRKIRTAMRERLSLQGYNSFLWKKQNQYVGEVAEYQVRDSPFKAGILMNRQQYHRHWIGACRDLGISYQLIDLEKADWIEQINHANCDIFLVWPEVSSTELKTMFDERLSIMVEQMHKHIYPSLLESSLYENKRLQHYWMQVNHVPCPKTWVFYNPEETFDFIEKCTFPIVFKSNLGASSSGVFILENKRTANKMIDRTFKDGIRLKGHNIHNRQKGNLYCQEYLPEVKEWRMVRIGNSFFGHGKERVGHFHSGSHKVNWDLPPIGAFNLLRQVTDIGGFTSMDMDLFETADGRFLVNELQTVFGTSIAGEQMKIEGQPGRYLYDDGAWKFEPGSFCSNHMCNLRIDYLHNNVLRNA